MKKQRSCNNCKYLNTEFSKIFCYNKESNAYTCAVKRDDCCNSHRFDTTVKVENEITDSLIIQL